MIPAIGILVVFAAIIGGFVLENGGLMRLAEPSELLIILGAAVGTMMTANPWPVLKQIARRMVLVFRGAPFTRDFYVGTLVMLYALFDFARRHGMSKFEDQMDKPHESILFSTHAAVMQHPGALAFVCDTLLMTSLGAIPPFDLDRMIEDDVDLRRRTMETYVDSLKSLADALPGLGIVAAVLGVVITMGGLKGIPSEIGVKVGRALVGTFLGIVASYGVVAPIAANLALIGEAECQYFETLRAGLVAFARGMPPLIAVECARRAIPTDMRPEFDEMEKACRGSLHAMRAKAA